MTGKEIYPHRKDMVSLPFWRCPVCLNYVGCHHRTADRTRPLGNIPTVQIRRIRVRIHDALDPLWKGGGWTRNALYARLSYVIGRQYHTGEIRTVDEAELILSTLKMLSTQGPL